MDANTVIQLATLISVVAAVVGLLVSVRAYQRQVSAQFLLQYSKRFDEIMGSLPPSVWAPQLFPNEGPPESSAELRLGVLRCLNYVAQLHYFSRKGYIPKGVWKMSDAGFRQLLRSPLFVRGWETLGQVFAPDRAFCRYVERAQRASDGK